MARVLALAPALLLLVLTGCRGGAAGRAALPEPKDWGQLLVIAIFVLGLWWIVMKVTRG
jgi:hypothetical protein